VTQVCKLVRALRACARGTGSMNYCGSWTLHHQHNDTQSFWLQTEEEQWVLGFLSGVSSVAGTDLNPTDRVDGPAIRVWMDNYCRVHPLELLASAAQQFVLVHPR
jgi:hypothetical protein